MAGLKPGTYSPTGLRIFRKALEIGWDRRRLALALFGDRMAQRRLTEFLQRDHTTRKLLEVAEYLGCPASELLPDEFFNPLQE